MKQKNEVLKCFRDFCSLIGNQFDARVKVLRTDNGTKYVNNEFESYLSAQGILHQTTCPDTPPQNGVAERKNRHILEIAHSLMYTMLCYADTPRRRRIRIRHVLDTDTPRIRLGYVSRRILKM